MRGWRLSAVSSATTTATWGRSGCWIWSTTSSGRTARTPESRCGAPARPASRGSLWSMTAPSGWRSARRCWRARRWSGRRSEGLPHKVLDRRGGRPQNERGTEREVMAAYLLIVMAVLSRVVPHPWMNITAVGAGLLYFGARRPLRELALPVLSLMATDYYLTVCAYAYPWHTSAYLITWAWYAAVVVLGWILLRRVSVTRLIAAPVIASTSFFAVSNYAVWA